jgi:hypothetical protein
MNFMLDYQLILHLRAIPLLGGSMLRTIARQILPCKHLTLEATMRVLLLVALATTAFAATMTYDATDANAVVCARGVVRAGCAGPNGAAVVGRGGAAVAGPNGGAAAVRAPVAACPYVVVNGVRVRRCS